MRIAVTYKNGDIFQHFGNTETFKIYDIEDNKIVNEQTVSTNGQGHGALSNLLFSRNVDILICGNIGVEAKNALAKIGIKLYSGVSGSADEALKTFIKGNLKHNPNVHCGYHCENHTCDSHDCYC